MNKPTDFLDREIFADDTLVYPVRRGSKMWLKSICVTKAEEGRIYGVSPEGRAVQLTNLKNTIVVH